MVVWSKFGSIIRRSVRCRRVSRHHGPEPETPRWLCRLAVGVTLGRTHSIALLTTHEGIASARVLFRFSDGSSRYLLPLGLCHFFGIDRLILDWIDILIIDTPTDSQTFKLWTTVASVTARDFPEAANACDNALYHFPKSYDTRRRIFTSGKAFACATLTDQLS